MIDLGLDGCKMYRWTPPLLRFSGSSAHVHQEETGCGVLRNFFDAFCITDTFDLLATG